jgi:protein-S-isoprenylcysteine O-methyltransferase Ste14
LLGGLLRLVLFMAFIFILAGRLDYWQGWVMTGTFVALMAVVALLFRHSADLLSEREKPGAGVKGWDRTILAILAAFWAMAFLTAALDGGRYGWTRSIPTYLYVSSYLIYALAMVLFLWAMYVNRFFSRAVRIQEDRGQVVIRHGPYRYIRHPGYTAGILLLIAIPVCLGSYYALMPSALAAVVLVVRTALEDKTLEKELKGYAEYKADVKYRLIPGVW